MRIHCLQHVPFEGPAAFAHWAASAGHEISTTRLYQAADLPHQSQFERLVVMGGPMGIHDESDHAWLIPEKEFIKKTITAGKTVIGVCLGAQLLAGALGAGVYRGTHKEIGWLPIELTEAARTSDLFGFLPNRFDVFHWHGDTFENPSGASRLASSPGCANQAFLYDGRVLGLQFHIESTPESVRALVANCADDLTAGPYVQNAEQILAAGPESFERANRFLFTILERLP
jgi:GMP synthase-like glutamine amidotransferase